VDGRYSRSSDQSIVLSPFVSQTFVVYIARSNREDLAMMSKLMASGKGKTGYRQGLQVE